MNRRINKLGVIHDELLKKKKASGKCLKLLSIMHPYIYPLLQLKNSDRKGNIE
jgi:hypothetical protein